jgi:FtsP/CotA-like multicopper oxidase with cupredoxin domain
MVAMSRSIAFTAALTFVSCGQRGVSLPDPPLVRAHDGVAIMTLTAARAPNGRSTFLFDGRDVPPTIRIAPGDTLKIHYVNVLPPAAPGAILGQMHMTNLHFHGLSVSPQRPQDDVLGMIAMPGQALDYTVVIPPNHPPGLYWYHTHPHGESHQQVLDGMSGALIVEGIERYAPAVRDLRERVLVIRAVDIQHDRRAAAERARVEIDRSRCGESRDEVDRVFTVNGTLRPAIAIPPGERQFWRIVNAASDRYVDLELPHHHLEVVAYDGVPIAYHDPDHPTRTVDHVLIPPAGRVEAIVPVEAWEGRSVLRTRCVDAGPDGDPGPGMILADLVSTPSASAAQANQFPTSRAAPPFNVLDVRHVMRGPPAFTAIFSEDKNGFYINGQKFSLDAAPMIRAKVGRLQRWRVLNNTREIHPFHIHQVHFLAVLENDRPIPDPQWLDTVNVPVEGSVDLVMDFTNPIIRGMSVFHCHLLNHEDKGMMAKILFE